MTKLIAEWNAAKFKHKMLVKSAEGMGRVCQFVAEKARANAPVRTGKLREEITYKLEVQEDVVEGIVGVGKEAFYARFIEMGTRFLPARPFLRPAVYENTDEIMRLLVGK